MAIAKVKKPVTNLYGGYKTPGEYVAAINRVEASGGNFQRPAEAIAFKAANPNLFSTGNVPSGEPTYSSPYAENINKTLTAITNRPSFSYDPSKDVGLQSAQTNAMDTVSRAAARRNMLYSESSKAQMGKSALELVPQFEQTAYNRYAGQGQDLYSQLSALSNLEGQEYDRYRDTVGDVRYGEERQLQQQQTAYQQARDSIADEQYKNEFDENVRQFGLSYGLQKLEADRNYEINKGQLSVQRMNASNAGPSTAGERKLQATSDLFDWGSKAYEAQKSAQWKDYTAGKTKDYPSPLYGTVEAFLTNPQIINASMSSGANRLQALDDLIRTYAGQSPDQYFKQGRAAKLKPLYDSLALRYSQQQGEGNALAAIISALAGQGQQ